MGQLVDNFYQVSVGAFEATLTVHQTASGINNQTWNDTKPLVPSGLDEAIVTVFSWGQGVVVVLGVIGILFCAGKMAVGKFGRSDLAADGVGGLVWTLLGISLMLVAVPLITQLITRATGTSDDASNNTEESSSAEFVPGNSEDLGVLHVSL